MSSASPPKEGFMNRMRRMSAEVFDRPHLQQATSEHVDELVNMGFPRGPAERQLNMSNNDVRAAAESLVHAAHPKDSTDPYNHPECPICVREKNNVRIAEGRRSSVSAAIHRATSRGGEGDDQQPIDGRRGSVGAMLRRKSVVEGLRRMTTRDVGHK
ncbi:hypothetical protein CcaverHIS002_0510160 [Cutaneotrichosporon cavernicola]|uniref:UBA domain-containing protein n=1 Tax=Cutaneotrichosporon cavernicola TaxID=279322 RepID=A0AA48L7K9_9TREE|nr:uncharacterized protein CcaverHIS019_0510720 [Cutaneotrichosporon cavernicola]BEI85615.1 hypothetical protein CcaverHIS002_0510160 [Cutaneotrichosporon cavernicola]BEI93444.1 hypothetical protein CcaverHIS019_0510720 [Cutaneotrichosporon cavernicola]BEJ01222.1 hypothetical protein CcaverHIS631_0510790 [Cutaneotrichosporon cavernicola]BEJ08990.1 hypothetical protein CcaverHIS641_0510840 [Cutaneotrichosporon cavernicola]